MGVGRLALRVGLHREKMLTVVPHLFNAGGDVVEGSVTNFFAGRRRQDLRVPSPSQLFERRDIDRAVVQKLFNIGHVDGQKTAIHADGVST